MRVRPRRRHRVVRIQLLGRLPWLAAFPLRLRFLRPRLPIAISFLLVRSSFSRVVGCTATGRAPADGDRAVSDDEGFLSLVDRIRLVG